jgi:hypothetical protein
MFQNSVDESTPIGVEHCTVRSTRGHDVFLFLKLELVEQRFPRSGLHRAKIRATTGCRLLTNDVMSRESNSAESSRAPIAARTGPEPIMRAARTKTGDGMHDHEATTPEAPQARAASGQVPWRGFRGSNRNPKRVGGGKGVCGYLSRARGGSCSATTTCETSGDHNSGTR